jgi:hypothetical protein
MKNLTVLVFCFPLVACGNSGNDHSTTPEPPPVSAPVVQTIAELERQGKLPTLDRSADLRGPDTNNNGVRDDIDRWIDSQSYSTSQKNAAIQSARALQETLFVNLTDPVQLKNAHDNITKAVGCVRRQFSSAQSIDPSKVLKTLQKYTMNTEGRALTYIKFNEALNGSQTELPNGDTCV